MNDDPLKKPSADKITDSSGSSGDVPTDTAGPLLGWSLKTGMQQRTLDELVEFPCVFTFKVVGISTDALLPSILGTVASVLGRDLTDAQHSCRDSSKGKYTSLTLEIPVESSDEVYSLYRALGKTDGVKFVL